MSVWEYVSALISIIIGLAAADLLISFHRLLRVDSRVQWYWLVPFVALYALLVIVNFWWGCFYWLSHLGSVSMVEFSPVLLAAISLFLVTAAVLPDEVPESGLDLKAWYLKNASHIWTLAFIALSLVVAIDAKEQFTSWQSGWAFIKSEWENWLTLAAFVAMIFTKRLRLHEVLVVAAFVDMVYTASWLRIG